MAENATEWFGMRVTPTQKAKIKRLAKRMEDTQKGAVLTAIEQALEAGRSKDESSESVLDLTEDLCGSVDGPRDLSTNPDHMKDYGRD
jgi:hypothetical protein